MNEFLVSLALAAYTGPPELAWEPVTEQVERVRRTVEVPGCRACFYLGGTDFLSVFLDGVDYPLLRDWAALLERDLRGSSER